MRKSLWLLRREYSDTTPRSADTKPIPCRKTEAHSQTSPVQCWVCMFIKSIPLINIIIMILVTSNRESNIDCLSNLYMQSFPSSSHAHTHKLGVSKTHFVHVHCAWWGMICATWFSAKNGIIWKVLSFHSLQCKRGKNDIIYLYSLIYYLVMF